MYHSVLSPSLVKADASVNSLVGNRHATALLVYLESSQGFKWLEIQNRNLLSPGLEICEH